MSASYDHELMVQGLMDWLKSPDCPITASQIFTDCTFFPGHEFPPILEGYRPDIFAISHDKKTYLIADAKTSKDVESLRTKEQLAGFVRWLSLKEASYIVLGVPWVSKASAMSLLKSLILSNSETEVIPIVVDCSACLLQKS